MAQSLSHRWGQIIGDILEKFVFDVLQEIAVKNGLFLDYLHPRAARNFQKKVSWQDAYGNKHDLDYVLERGGTGEVLGMPVAFVESAWRRYKKHSKNKVQEIEAAVIPVASAFSQHHPFCGAILAGEFTANSIKQLESKGFVILLIPYFSVMTVFRTIGVDASSEDLVDGTSEEQFREKIDQWESKNSVTATAKIISGLRKIHRSDIRRFSERLEGSISRSIIKIQITILNGSSMTYVDINKAINFLVKGGQPSDWGSKAMKVETIEVQIHFNTKAKIEAIFSDRVEAIAFLRSHGH